MYVRKILSLIIFFLLISPWILPPPQLQAANLIDPDSIKLLTDMYNKQQSACQEKIDQAKSTEQSYGSCGQQQFASCMTSIKPKDPRVCTTGIVEKCRYIVDDFLKDCQNKKCQQDEELKDGKCVKSTESTEQKPGTPSITEKIRQSCPDENHLELDNKTNQCICKQLYRKSDKSNDCIFIGAQGLSMDTDSYNDFADRVDNLDSDKSDIFEGKTSDGKKVLIGILRLPDGKYLFTSDGIHFYNNAKDAYNPGLVLRLKTKYADAKKSLLINLFGIGKYIDKETKGDPDKQADGQMRLDSASEAFKNLQSGINDPEKRVEMLKKLFDKMLKPLQDYLGDNWKNSYTFPAEAVNTLAKEIRTDNFANAVRLYISEREQNKKPDEILISMDRGDSPILDFVTNIQGVSQQFARASLIGAYEEAYQRYLLAKRLKSK